jgi:hypothetical protein
MPNPWVSLRCNHLIPVNKAVNEKKQLAKRVRRRRRKKTFLRQRYLVVFDVPTVIQDFSWYNIPKREKYIK